MKIVTKMTSDERKTEFIIFLKAHVNSAPKYISALERGFSEAPVKNYKSIYDVSNPELLEDLVATKGLRESSAFTRATSGGTSGLAGLNWYIRFLKDSRDSYYDFMNHFGIKPKDLFDWGVNAIVFPSDKMVDIEWQNLKRRIFNNEAVYIRGYGRDAHGTKMYTDFYGYAFKNFHVIKDPTNNNRPQANIKKMTGLTRNKDIYNYQVSHIWGRTKNLFLFEAPWNVCYMPKIIDPFTGHETKGDLPVDFQEYFIKKVQKKYRKYIDDYNSIISTYNINKLLSDYCSSNGINDSQFVNDAANELSIIPIIK